MKKLLCKLIGHNWFRWQEDELTPYRYFSDTPPRMEKQDYRKCLRCELHQYMIYEGFGEWWWVNV